MAQAPSRRDFLKSTVLASASLALSSSSNADALSAEPQAVTAIAPAPVGGAFTRGVGVYPGAPAEDFSPTLVGDTSGIRRNLALRRPAYHSSSYDYNHTAQLVTDGIVTTEQPRTLSLSVSGRGTLAKDERESLSDHYPTNVLPLAGPLATVEFTIEGPDLPTVDRVVLFLVMSERVAPSSLHFSIATSNDGYTWQDAGTGSAGAPLPTADYPPDLVRQSQVLKPAIALIQPVSARRYRLTMRHGEELAPGKLAASTGAPLAANGGEGPFSWRLGQVEFHHGEERVEFGGPYHFTSAWKSAGAGTEWVYVDLGAGAEFDQVKLSWVARAAAGELQVSDDAEHWRTLQPLPGAGAGLVDDLHLSAPTRARYLRVLMTRPAAPQGYVLSELEVWGRGGFTLQPKPTLAASADGRLVLSGGRWRLERDSLVSAAGAAIAQPGFDDASWLAATVPGTTLVSYLNADAIPDPNYGDNQFYISDSFFYADFWYRTEFVAPTAPAPGELEWLDFAGINWKAEVWLNGKRLGRIDGGFMRGRFDVTGKLKRDAPNALAVRVEKNRTPGSVKQKTLQTAGKNGGGLGADNPTYHASIGWDWISTIRGRNTGLWGEIALRPSGPVTIENPLVTSKLPLPDTSSAEVAIECVLANHAAKPVAGTLHGRFGDVHFEQRVQLAPSEQQVVKLTPMHIAKPQLWWPAGYGEPHLYDVELTFEAHGSKRAETTRFRAGVRQVTYQQTPTQLRIFINGRRFIAKGGNWGFSESMLRYRQREYDTAARLHAEANMNMARNWVGQIGDDAFWDACDRYGVMVWQDFWLANPWDGPIPDDNELFLANARDFIHRIRRHASLGIYCGRNEGDPPAPLEAGLRRLLAELHPDLLYIPSSADYSVSGHGPYSAQSVDYYFRTADSTLHSEIGAPNIPPIESVRAMMPPKSVWPQGLDWGLHDFCLNSAMHCAGLRTIIDESYGGADNAEEWIGLAQFVNYTTYRAMFEAQSRDRMGLLLWMSHPCWPSFVWQTYDYYFEPTAAYFGVKKACEPLHIQWNPLTNDVEVLNWSGGDQRGLRASVAVLNLDGSRVFESTATVDSPEDSTKAALRMVFPPSARLSPTHFVALKLQSSAGRTLSSNFYLRGVEQDDFRAIRTLVPAHVVAQTSADRNGGRWLLTTRLSNSSSAPALMVRVQAVREDSGDRILPAFYSDNYFALMPGEQSVITTELLEADTRGERPAVVVSGFNVAAARA